MFDWLIVGAGFAGSVLAERLASQRNERVLLIDRRFHIGGNAYDRYDAAGILMHVYGPHIFHTNSDDVVAYLSQFTRWRPYEHRVLACVEGTLYPIPINRTTVNRLFSLNLQSDEAVEKFYQSQAEPRETIASSEDVIVGRVGRDLYEKFFRYYTRKQWGLDPSELDRSVTSRVPIRTNDDDRYFGDTFQAMPRGGYTRMFEAMLAHPNIKIMLNTDFNEIRHDIPYKRLIYTGPIDAFFGYRFGRLPYRSLRFDHQTLDQEWLQPVAVVNYPQQEPYTRVTEYKHLTGQNAPVTSITYEYPSATGDPYYPVPNDATAAIYRAYDALAYTLGNAWFVGRLATYRYYNMDQVVAQALATFRRIDASLNDSERPRGPLVTDTEITPHLRGG